MLFSAVFFSILFILSLNGYLEFIVKKPFLWLGSISYSLYLLHQNLGYIIIRFLYTFEVNNLFVIAIPTMVSLLLAALVTYFIEKPVQNYLRSRLL